MITQQELSQVYDLYTERLQNPDSYVEAFNRHAVSARILSEVVGLHLEAPELISHGILAFEPEDKGGEVCVPWLIDPADERGYAAKGRHKLVGREFHAHELTKGLQTARLYTTSTTSSPIWSTTIWKLRDSGHVVYCPDHFADSAAESRIDAIAGMTGAIATLHAVFYERKTMKRRLVLNGEVHDRAPSSTAEQP